MAGKTTTGYPPRDPKGAKPMKDPQLDMKTWKPPKIQKSGGYHGDVQKMHQRPSGKNKMA